MTGYDADDYQAQALALLPPGVAWSRRPDSVLGRLLGAIAEELARLDGRRLDLLDEADPSTAIELLPDWERLCGIPDGCAKALRDTIPERQAAVVAHLTTRRGQSKAYFIGLAASLDTITIEEFRPWRCGQAECGVTPLAPAEIVHTWRVHRPFTEGVGQWRCGQAECGVTPLGWFERADELECRLNKAKPAHTTLLIAYTPRGRQILLSDGTPLLLSDGQPARFAYPTPLELETANG